MTTKTEAQEPKLAHTPAICIVKKLSARDWMKQHGLADELRDEVGPLLYSRIMQYVDEFAEASLEAAAAPELLEAAKSGASALRNALIQALDVGLYDSEKEWREAIDNHPTLKALNAAIAKATRAEGMAL